MTCYFTKVTFYTLNISEHSSRPAPSTCSGMWTASNLIKRGLHVRLKPSLWLHQHFSLWIIFLSLPPPSSLTFYQHKHSDTQSQPACAHTHTNTHKHIHTLSHELSLSYSSSLFISRFLINVFPLSLSGEINPLFNFLIYQMAQKTHVM